MKYEKIIKRSDNTQIKIIISIYLEPYRNTMAEYKVEILIKPKGKRKWRQIEKDIADYEYRNLKMAERKEYDKLNNLRFATKEEIHLAKLEIWKLMKPQMV